MAKTATQVKTDIVTAPGRAKGYHGKSKGLAPVPKRSEYTKKADDNGLTERMSRYVDEYITNGGNSFQACIAAGYTPKSAIAESSRLLKHPRVKAEIVKKQQALRVVSIYTIEDHARELGEQRLLALADKQHTAAAKLLELQGKLRGFYTERLEITHKYEQMSDEELRMKVLALQQDTEGVWHHPIHHIEGEHG